MTAKKRWLPAEDHLLLAFHRHHATPATMGVRFNCTGEEVLERLEFLRKNAASVTPTPAPDPNGQPLLTAQELMEMKRRADPMQGAFLDMCARYNELGEFMRHFAELVSSSLGVLEVELMIVQCFQAPRGPEESLAQYLARGLLQQCIVIPRPLVTPAAPVEPPKA